MKVWITVLSGGVAKLRGLDSLSLRWECIVK